LEDIVRVILDRYSAKHSPNPPYKQALLTAASAPHTRDTREVLKVLVDAASRGTPKNILRESPEILKTAVMLGNGRQVCTLCELGADINAIDGKGQSLLHLAAGRSSALQGAASASVIMTLIHLGLGVDSEDHHGETPLHKSCKSGLSSIKGSRILLQHGADVHHKTRMGNLRFPFWRASGRIQWTG
jgi:ankyrin repeat protein